MQGPRKNLSRRRFLELTGASLGMATLAACGSTPPPSGSSNPTQAPAPPAAAGGTATAAPAPPAAAPEPTPGIRQAASGRDTIIEVWYPYGGTASTTLQQYWEAYEKQNTKVGIKAVYAANDLSTNAKLFTAIASGRPPDVSWVDGPQVAEWAARNALEPLDARIAQSGFGEDDFWAPSWEQNSYNGKVWALTYSSDPNFGFFWNKDVFKDAGLDSETPPKTIAEMDEMNDKIAVVQGNRIDRLGLIPWTVYGSSNSLFTWGWAFGGEFYDPDARKITANDEKVVDALDWMVSYAKKYNPERVSGFQAGFGTGEQNPFYVGKIAMAPFGPWELSGLKQYAPELKYGITFLPTGPNGAPPKSSWVGGWCVGLPRGAKQTDAGFEFIDWLTTSDEATTIQGNAFTGFPGFKNSPYYETVQKSAELKPFYDILVATKHQRPVMPAQAFYTGALATAVDAAIFGQQSSKQALDTATSTTQKELDRILKEGVS